MSSILDQLSDDSQASPRATEKSWSPFQLSIFDAIKERENLLIQAVAGSGKTTTIIEGLKWAQGTSLFMAFNKSIALDIASRAPRGEVKTLNALGHSIVMANRPEAKLNARKTMDLLKGIMEDSPEFKEYGYTLSRVIGLAKNCALGISKPPETQDFIDLIDAYGFDIPFDRLSDFAIICREGFERSRLDEKTFDFDDQLWLPVFHLWMFPQYDNVFIDEAQDLSPIQHLMLQQLRESRIVAVGDRHQAIYGFRGASHDSMDLLKQMFKMQELPLSICYRCAQVIVTAAQEFCPTIQWREGAPKGEILDYDVNPTQWAQHMVLCRNNAPLFAEILRCVRRREPCQVKSNFLDSFQSFIRGFKATHTSDLRAKLDRWFEREREACLAKGKTGKLRGLYDKYETVKLLADEFTLVSDMVNMVKSLGESTRGPIFATIHKAKGLEHPSVYLLRPDLLGGFGDLTPEQKQQEDNLHYVAITRAQERLGYGARPRKF